MNLFDFKNKIKEIQIFLNRITLLYAESTCTYSMFKINYRNCTNAFMIFILSLQEGEMKEALKYTNELLELGKSSNK